MKGLLAEGKLRGHRTSPQEIGDLFNLVERDIADARVEGLSTDRRFAIAYEAALNLATIALYCKGYETRGYGHHFHTFKALREIMGREGEAFADYFDICRTKRAATIYDRAGAVSEQELHELLGEVQTFRDRVEDWLKENYPHLWPWQ